MQLLPQKGEPLTAKTDARGAFALDELPHGVPFELRVAAPSCGTIRLTEIVLERNEKRSVGTLWLDPSVRLPVQVRTWADQPVEGAVVEAFSILPTDQADGWKAFAQMLQAPTPVGPPSCGTDGFTLATSAGSSRIRARSLNAQVFSSVSPFDCMVSHEL